jgi:methylaspartate ammonia-lyase
MRIKSGEKIYTSYLLELKDGSFVAIIAKELVNGRLDFVIFSHSGSEERVLLKVKDLGKREYDTVVSGLIKSLGSEGLLVDARMLCQKHSKEILKLVG